MLKLLVQHPEGVERLQGFVSPQDFHHEMYAALAAWLWSGRTGTLAPEADALLRELSLDAVDAEHSELLIDVAGRMFLLARLQREMRAHRNRMGATSEGVALQETQALAERLARVSREVEELKRSVNQLGV